MATVPARFPKSTNDQQARPTVSPDKILFKARSRVSKLEAAIQMLDGEDPALAGLQEALLKAKNQAKVPSLEGARSTSANFDFGQLFFLQFGQFDFGQFLDVEFWDDKGWSPEGWGPEGWGPKPRKSGAPKGGAPKGGAPKGGAPKGGALKGGAPKGGGPKGGGPKISRFFCSLPPEISFFLLSLGGLLVEFWWCLKRRDA